MAAFFILEHQHKAEAYRSALEEAGYRPTFNRENARFLLLDLDVLGRAHMVKEAALLGIPSFLYPHAARPPIQWDGLYPPSPYVKAHFVVAEGHKAIMQAYGYPHEIIPVGWTYCPILPFKPNLNPVNVLFAPVHANSNGYICDAHVKMNTEAYTILVKLHRQGKIKLSVRYLHSFHRTGCWVEKGVRIITGRPDGSYEDIDRADVVVAHQTFAYIAIARGKPTLMFNEDMAPLSGNDPDNMATVASFEKYKSLLQYPYDLLTVKCPLDLIQEAAFTDEKIADWRQRIIGEPFNPTKFVQHLERLL